MVVLTGWRKGKIEKRKEEGNGEEEEGKEEEEEGRRFLFTLRSKTNTH